ncbi:MAG: LacI family DNA-binding transcriptional regulator [Verrucomicrobiae bacterium]|nr:LacI family DNA-binding transcriptional regulator [Verrucomicrobiae bacterium]
MPTTPLTTLKRIAEQLHVSETTVSRILSGQAARYRISKKTEHAVSQLARAHNFVPNPLARGLRLKKTLSVGLVIPDISNPFFAGIAREVALGARKRGYSVILCDSQDDTGLEAQSIALLRSRRVDGIVLCPVGLASDHLREFTENGLPIVLVDRCFSDLPLPYVGVDNLTGAKDATRHLIENGHRHISCLQGLRGTSPNESRLRGYIEALAEHHLPLDRSLIVGGDSYGEASGYIETKFLLQARKDVTALLAFGNLIALGALRALAEEKLRIPEDISIISFDNQPYLAHLAAPMTTVDQPYAEMGQLAVTLLFDQVQPPGRALKGGALLPTNFIIRRSVRKLC